MTKAEEFLNNMTVSEIMEIHDGRAFRLLSESIPLGIIATIAGMTKKCVVDSMNSTAADELSRKPNKGTKRGLSKVRGATG
jgi:hypothetical protein